jgi:hypothetical protein
MSVSRKVLRYAEEVLQASTQARPPKQSTEHSAPSAKRTSADEFLSIPQHHGPKAESKSWNYPTPVNSTSNIPLSVGALGLEEKEFVIFKNVDGKEYLFPYKAVQDWDVSSIKFLITVRAHHNRTHKRHGYQ